MPFVPDPAAAFLSDFGATVVRGSFTTTGTLEVRPVLFEDAELGGVQSEKLLLTVPRGALGTLAADQALTVAGVAYTVSLVGDAARRATGVTESGQFDHAVLRRGA